jgi:hypothetical protein
MQHLERDFPAIAIEGKKNPRGPTTTDFPLNVVQLSESVTDAG